MAFKIAGRSFDDLIWQCLVFDGHLADVPTTWERTELAQGASVLTPVVRLGPRGFKVSLDLWPPSLVDREATMDALKRRNAGVLPLVSDSAPGRVWYVRLANCNVEIAAGNLVNPRCYVDLEFTAHDPRRYDVETQVRVLSATPVECPVGTAVGLPTTIRLFGAATAVVNPIVDLYRFDGALLSSLALTISLGTNTWLDIECGSEWIHLVTAGVRTQALAALGGGVFPQLSGEDGASSTGPHPLLALRSTSGTPTGLVMWRRGW